VASRPGLILPPTSEAIAAAVEAIRSGRLIGFPTETVYGIGANALDREAIRRTYALKGRPADNPLIVHVADTAQARQIAAAWPDAAEELARRFWPGPLTMVLPKRPEVPNEATGGLDTVAIRVPGLDTARRIISAAGVPITAPSANPFMALSPTRVEMLDPQILAGLDVVIDCGPCEVGIESTVVDVSGPLPVVLRPGVIDLEFESRNQGERRSPGMYLRHYAPRKTIELVDRLGDREGLSTIGRDPNAVARTLYADLYEWDRSQSECILVELPPDEPQWRAVRDRLLKAASK